MYVCRWHFPGFFVTKGVNSLNCRFVPSSCKADYRRLQMAMTVAIYPDSCSHPEYAHALHCKLLWVWNFPGGPETPSWCASHRLGDVCRTRYRQGRAKCRCAASCSSRLPRTGWSARGAYPILGCILVDGSIKPHALEVYSLIDLYWINRDESWWNHFQSAYHWPDVDAFMPCRSRSRARHRQWQRSFGRSDGSTPQRNSCKSTPLRTPILTTLSPPFLQCAILLLFGVVLFEPKWCFLEEVNIEEKKAKMSRILNKGRHRRRVSSLPACYFDILQD